MQKAVHWRVSHLHYLFPNPAESILQVRNYYLQIKIKYSFFIIGSFLHISETQQADNRCLFDVSVAFSQCANELLQINHSMEEITANRKGNRIRIVLLKEVPQQTPLYDPSRTKSRAPLSHDSTIRSKPNHTSIAYLSSILQDEHLQTEKSTVPLSEEDEGDGVGESFDNLEEFRRKDKKSSRYLSCLLETEGEEHAHSKTEGMERLLRRRRIMPIDKIQPRRKNITFSLKNKRELNKDFQEFVNSKNAISAFREEPPPPARDEQTIAFPIKQYADKRVASLRGERGEKRKRRAMQHLQLLDGNAALPSTLLRKTNVETKEPGYAIAFKRLSSDIPHINSFEWSRLDHHPYHLIKG